MQQRAQFCVRGLDCAEEVLLLKREFKNAPGVSNLEFDVINAKMVVSFDDELNSSAKIIDAVARTGLTAVPWAERNRGEAPSWWQQNARLVLTCLAGTLLVAASVVNAAAAKDWQAVFSDDDGVPLSSRLLYVASIISGIWFVLPKAWGSIRRFLPDMNLLMSLAVVGAMVIGEWFEAATVTFLFSLALLLEQWSMHRTRLAIANLLDLSPSMASCLDPQNGNIESRPVENVPVGTLVLVKSHERIPLDGIVRKGTSSVNEAPITGESIPVAKEPENEVFAGTINNDGNLEFEVTRPADETALARIVQMIEEAHSRRAPSEQWVETFAKIYTPTMMALAAAIAFGPPLLVSADWTEWIYRSLVLLVIACPCALVISTPVSIVSALASAARHGVLIKGGRYLEATARLKAIAMDKTGTLTFGRPVVQKILACNGHSVAEVLQRAAAMEVGSQHPLARAVLKRAAEEGVEVTRAENYRVISGWGAEGEFAGKPFWIGSHRMMHEAGAETPDIHDQALAMEDAGHTLVAVGNSDHVCGLIGVADDVRDGVARTIAALRNVGVKQIVMLTGDNEKTAGEVAKIAGVDGFQAGLLPEEKVREVESLCREYRTVAMLGDGVNDAPAMAVATVGIAMGAMGSDVAIETADVALMSDDLSKLPWLIAHARRTLSIIKQNIVFALGLKLAFVVLTFVGMASLWMAIAADTGASLLVILNGMRLLNSGTRECESLTQTGTTYRDSPTD